MNLRFAICLFLALSLGPCAFARETSDAITLQARQARDRGEIETLQTLIRTVRDEAARTNAFDTSLRLALFDAWLCEAAHDHQDDKLVKQAAQDGVAAAERAVKLNSESSEAHRLAGELLGQLIPHIFAGGMRHGAYSTAEIEKAIRLDPQNPSAYVARASIIISPQKRSAATKIRQSRCSRKPLLRTLFPMPLQPPTSGSQRFISR